MTVIAVSAAAFADPGIFRRRVQDIADYMKSSPPAEGFDEVIMPGELEYRTYEERVKTGISLPEETTWAEICSIAEEFGVAELAR